MGTLTVPLASARTTPLAGRLATLLYGFAAYTIGVGGLLWLIAITLGLLAFEPGPIAIDSTQGRVLFNLSLIGLFGVQHTIMARPAFKRRWSKVLPPSIERSTFVLVTGVITATMMWCWQPLPREVWSVETPWLRTGMVAVCVAGWAYMFASTFAIDHFQLFGLAQVTRHFRGLPQVEPRLVARFTYRFDRHPLMSGILVGLWSHPTVDLGYLVLAAGFTLYIVIGVAIEERRLVELHGDSYKTYRREVGALVPLPGRR